ncbi:nuclear transport factor 2 family protein [Sphingomonas sp. So64.6b]|uniref:nuclear transport factor 2 family protein n=1 Tax=Sphingomonas sp. So64.6b TaxID=2997354 RepID=UPI0015FEE4EF|nr:nuclear transport factor 2 family protein [Sphingomonas sp. So64.6b]QNA84182.1 nuclear transport factor 2 family protein [Sphingomonas sp. So64.6b]
MSDTPTDQERRAIEGECARLVNRYANLNDAGDWDAVAALYAADGSMTRPTAPDQPIVGREAILAAFLARPSRTTRHICANIVIDVESPTMARGESAMLLFTGAAAPLVGSFHDRFVLTTDGWRFAERRGSILFAP